MTKPNETKVIQSTDRFHLGTDYVYCGDVPSHKGANPSEANAALEASGFVRQLRVWVLAAVRAAKSIGLTAKEACRKYRSELGAAAGDEGTLRNSIAPRLTELAHAGLIYPDHNQARREKCAPYVAEPGRDDADGNIILRSYHQPQPEPRDRGDE